MKVLKNSRKTIATLTDEFRSIYFGDKEWKYIYSIDEEIPKDNPIIVVGSFSEWDVVKEIAVKAYKENKDLIIFPPETVSIIEARHFLKELCGETPLYISSDGLVLAPGLKKGYTLSLTMPIYNEAATLDEVIESFLPVADEIVIGVDEKTDDGSKEIALKYTNQVFWYKWEKSFAKARNQCMKNCTSDWIFMTEGHESLLDTSYPAFQFIKGLPEQLALINVKRIIAGARYQFSMFPWITRNKPFVKYIYDSHNAVISEDNVVCEQVNFPQIATLHERPESKEEFRTAQRRVMNRVNLLKDLQKNPRDARALFYIANEYFSFKEHEKAIEYYKRYLAVSTYADERYQAKLSCARCLLILKREKDAIEMFNSCFIEPVARNDHMIYLADYYTEKKIDLSIYYFKMAATVQEPVSPMWINSDFYKDYPLKRLTGIYSRLGRLDDALWCINILKDRGCGEEVKEVELEILAAQNSEDKKWDNYHDTTLDINKVPTLCV